MRVTTKGQVTIPKDIRDLLGIEPGSDVEFVNDAHGAVKLQVVRADDQGRGRAEAIREWAARARGTMDFGGRTPSEYFEWVRGPRDDLSPR